MENEQIHVLGGLRGGGDAVGRTVDRKGQAEVENDRHTRKEDEKLNLGGEDRGQGVEGGGGHALCGGGNWDLGDGRGRQARDKRTWTSQGKNSTLVFVCVCVCVSH
jgi:hypothetical protein